jgi:tyrosine-specific transport protein
MSRINNRVIGGILLVSGTTIGAGMLALPTTTGLAGFYPSLVLFFVYWALLAYTAFLMLEVTLWMDAGTNLVTMARKTLGKGGEVVSWATYLFLMYALTTAYLAGSSGIFLESIHFATGIEMPSWFGPVPLLVIFGFFVFQGAKAVDLVNRVLMLGLFVTYTIMVMLLLPHVEAKLLNHVSWKCLLVSSSIVATSYGFHIIIPTLATYLNRNVRNLLIVITVGSILPLIVYLLWEVVSLGNIPVEGTCGIKHGYRVGANGVWMLAGVLNETWVNIVAKCFASFAIITSFLGVSLSLRDFLADGFKIKKDLKGKARLYLLTFAPALLFVWTDPRAFLSALEYAGAFGVMILLGILPALMVWRGRYHHRFASTFTTPGGKPALVVVMILCSVVIAIWFLNKTGIETILEID